MTTIQPEPINNGNYEGVVQNPKNANMPSYRNSVFELDTNNNNEISSHEILGGYALYNIRERVRVLSSKIRNAFEQRFNDIDTKSISYDDTSSEDDIRAQVSLIRAQFEELQNEVNEQVTMTTVSDSPEGKQLIGMRIAEDISGIIISYIDDKGNIDWKNMKNDEEFQRWSGDLKIEKIDISPVYLGSTEDSNDNYKDGVHVYNSDFVRIELEYTYDGATIKTVVERKDDGTFSIPVNTVTVNENPKLRNKDGVDSPISN